MKNFRITGIICVWMVFSGGCIVVTDNNFEHDKCGIPKDASRIGGGLEITYIASEDGVINLIDRNACKSLMSKTITAGEKYEFNAKQLNAEEEKKWGVDIKKADFVLYFFPAHPKPPVAGGQAVPPLPPIPPVPSVPPVPPQPVQP